jgi:hypothetical protein
LNYTTGHIIAEFNGVIMNPDMLPIVVIIVVLAAIAAFIGWQFALLRRDPEGYVRWIRRWTLGQGRFSDGYFLTVGRIGLPIAMLIVVGIIGLMIFIFITEG